MNRREAYREAFMLGSVVGPTGQGGMDIPTGYLCISGVTLQLLQQPEHRCPCWVSAGWG